MAVPYEIGHREMAHSGGKYSSLPQVAPRPFAPGTEGNFDEGDPQLVDFDETDQFRNDKSYKKHNAPGKRGKKVRQNVTGKSAAKDKVVLNNHPKLDYYSESDSNEEDDDENDKFDGEVTDDEYHAMSCSDDTVSPTDEDEFVEDEEVDSVGEESDLEPDVDDIEESTDDDTNDLYDKNYVDKADDFNDKDYFDTADGSDDTDHSDETRDSGDTSSSDDSDESDDLDDSDESDDSGDSDESDDSDDSDDSDKSVEYETSEDSVDSDASNSRIDSSNANNEKSNVKVKDTEDLHVPYSDPSGFKKTRLRNSLLGETSVSSQSESNMANYLKSSTNFVSDINKKTCKSFGTSEDHVGADNSYSLLDDRSLRDCNAPPFASTTNTQIVSASTC